MSLAIRTPVGLLALWSLAIVASAEATIEYDFKTESVQHNHAPVVGASHVTSPIDGPNFRNVTRRTDAAELSDDDGCTTYFGASHSTPVNTPLEPEHGHPFAAIVGTIEDETLVVDESQAGPDLFGLPTRVYTVDYTYAIAARVVYAFRHKELQHALFTYTVAYVGVSAAAIRVALSRGFGHALSQRGEAFTGSPLLIEGTIESALGMTKVRVEAVSFQL